MISTSTVEFYRLSPNLAPCSSVAWACGDFSPPRWLLFRPKALATALISRLSLFGHGQAFHTYPGERRCLGPAPNLQ